MTPERWRQVNELFHAVLEQDASTRQQILERTASEDPELAAEVRSLLAAHESDEGLLDRPAWAAAPHLVLDDEGALHPGTQAGPYRIVREIGRGGMGIVYEAEDMRLRRAVALKALPAQYARDPVRRGRLVREARAAAALTHPNIATIYALDELDGTLYLVSELVRGETLRDEVRQGPLPPDRLLSTLKDLASGLAAAHGAGIVHRDFKPENVIRSGDGRVKILDFGLARFSSSDAFTQVQLTQAGAALGTPGYMAPEQLGSGPVDARTDVFAFGIVAWELATGAHPFGKSSAELLARMTDLLEGRPVTAAGPELPLRGLEAVLRKCLRRDPSERYASAIELVDALEGIGTEAGESAPVQRTRPAAGSAVWWWKVHQGAIAAIVAAMPVACWFLRRTEPRLGPLIFLVVLALATISVTIRLNLLFTARVHPSRVSSQRARVYTPMAVAEVLLGLILLGAAALIVAGPQDALAAVLVALAVVTMASLGIIEPATTAAAFSAEQEAPTDDRPGVPR